MFAILRRVFAIIRDRENQEAGIHARTFRIERGFFVTNPLPQAAAQARAEFTIRGLIIGIVITIVFTAANVYFGLKAGLTFSTSIPAAVISMAILKAMRDATIQENNIVQTVASAAGTLSSIIFVLPGFIMIGWWNGFPYWQSVAICAAAASG